MRYKSCIYFLRVVINNIRAVITKIVSDNKYRIYTRMPEPKGKKAKKGLALVIFVGFVKDNAAKSSIRYSENHASFFVQNRRK